MDVVVIGAGIVGLASTHALAQQGATVTVCEKETVGAGSTERSAGGIRTQFSTPVNVELSRASIEVWERFEERFGVDIAYRRSGYLFLARTAATADRFRENVAMQNDLGVPSEYLDPEAAREHCPGLDPEPFVGATYCGLDGFADPHLALQGYSSALAEEPEVEIETGRPVTDVRVHDGRVVGVETPTGHIDAGFVVNAAGPWARRVASLAGIDLPVAPRRRQIAVVEPSEPIPESVPLTIDLETGSYFRPEREGTALVGGHFADEPAPRARPEDGDGAGESDPDADPDGYDTGMDLEWAATAVDRAGSYAKYFGPETRIRRGWAGLYAVTPDHHPILEETIPGFVNAAGFSGHGFQHAPATGRVVAELVVDGSASLVDPTPLSSDRFEDGAGPTEHNVA